MLSFREKQAEPLTTSEINDFAKKLAVELPSDYKVFLGTSATGLLTFNFTSVRLESDTEQIGIDSIDGPEKVIFHWNNLKGYDRFMEHQIIPIGGLLSPRTLCMGYGKHNLNQLFILGTNLEVVQIHETLEGLIEKIEYQKMR